MRFSSKSGQNIGIRMFSRPFLEKTVFHIKPSEASFPLGMSGNCLLDSDNCLICVLATVSYNLEISTPGFFKDLFPEKNETVACVITAAKF